MQACRLNTREKRVCRDEALFIHSPLYHTVSKVVIPEASLEEGRRRKQNFSLAWP